MQKILLTLTLLGIVNLVSCSGGENMLEVTVTTAQRPVIPAAAASCLSRRVGDDTNTPPAYDIEAAYFTIPKLTFAPKHTDKIVYISFIKITYNLPGESTPKTCEFGGDQLAALKTAWYTDALKEAKIPANAAAADLVTDCPIYCGGIDKDLPAFSSTGSVVVYGYEQNPNDENDAVGFTTTTYINFGKQ